LQTCQLDLDTGLTRSGSPGKDIQDDARSIRHGLPDPSFEISPLRRRQFIVEENRFDLEFLGQLLDLVNLTAPDEGSRINGAPLLGNRSYHLEAGSISQLREFMKVFFDESSLSGILNDPHGQGSAGALDGRLGSRYIESHWKTPEASL
jgi:hypothetical protein